MFVGVGALAAAPNNNSRWTSPAPHNMPQSVAELTAFLSFPQTNDTFFFFAKKLTR